jgi:copper chaperone CopZ
MFNTTAYVHTLDGRLRIKSAAVKGAPEKARAIEKTLKNWEGVTQVTANPVTGSVLVHYDSQGVTQHELLQALESFGCLQQGKRHAHAATESVLAAQDGFGHGILKTIVLSTLEFTVQRLVVALI